VDAKDELGKLRDALRLGRAASNYAGNPVERDHAAQQLGAAPERVAGKALTNKEMRQLHLWMNADIPVIGVVFEAYMRLKTFLATPVNVYKAVKQAYTNDPRKADAQQRKDQKSQAKKQSSEKQHSQGRDPQTGRPNVPPPLPFYTDRQVTEPLVRLENPTGQFATDAMERSAFAEGPVSAERLGAAVDYATAQASVRVDAANELMGLAGAPTGPEHGNPIDRLNSVLGHGPRRDAFCRALQKGAHDALTKRLIKPADLRTCVRNVRESYEAALADGMDSPHEVAQSLGGSVEAAIESSKSLSGAPGLDAGTGSGGVALERAVLMPTPVAQPNPSAN
jgi:hypothetical protein